MVINSKYFRNLSYKIIYFYKKKASTLTFSIFYVSLFCYNTSNWTILDKKSNNYCNYCVIKCLWIGNILAWILALIIFLIMIISNIYIKKRKNNYKRTLIKRKNIDYYKIKSNIY